jgi:hypothetical protein
MVLSLLVSWFAFGFVILLVSSTHSSVASAYVLSPLSPYSVLHNSNNHNRRCCSVGAAASSRQKSSRTQRQPVAVVGSTGVVRRWDKRLDPLNAFSFNSNKSTQKSTIQVGLYTAQFLLDTKKHPLLRRQITDRYPALPAPLVGSALQLVSHALATANEAVLPSTLKQALRSGSGAIERLRPKLDQTIVDWTIQQPLIQSIPLQSHKEKVQLIAAIVDLALDQLQQEFMLSTPECRLDALYDEMEQIVRYDMTRIQYARYRLRRLLSFVWNNITQRPGVSVVLSTATAALVAGWWLSQNHEGGVSLSKATRKTMMTIMTRIPTALTQGWMSLVTLWHKLAGSAVFLYHFLISSFSAFARR